ncbi:CGNR zinc finger domain-containing protein [Spiractinospora alimapuensis]|uniref:CGNR zinc finger domain-containing protein n=1 Tax=Spiractinospora alimapuensis TaxID=2820884 RepID=UPI001F2CDA79|nr:CGNR zinc finger domain-containing protein [Spiractinospora alimapuensis]QVQ53475.1 CGNR zinc finger domain-containing protein [Spiractinospora alimapuensis]
MHQPPAARRVEEFANTFDLESGRDDLSDADGLARWLTASGHAEAALRVSATDHQMCLDLRAGIREALSTDRPPVPHLLARADSALTELPVLVSLAQSTATGGHPPDARALVPAPSLPPVRRVYASLALDWAELVTTGQVTRLKLCAEHTCRWVFWDGSKNQSRRWCSMRVCGNRTKSRRHSERARAPESEN